MELGLIIRSLYASKNRGGCSNSLKKEACLPSTLRGSVTSIWCQVGRWLRVGTVGEPKYLVRFCIRVAVHQAAASLGAQSLGRGDARSSLCFLPTDRPFSNLARDARMEVYFFHEAVQCPSAVERNALFSKTRTGEQCFPPTFNHHLLVSCLGNQLFEGAGALGSTLSRCWWVPSSIENLLVAFLVETVKLNWIFSRLYPVAY
nr:uncharacterized protein LOC110362657 [Columba livia]